MSATFFITPLGPIVARDGRPFGTGSRIRLTPWIYPSVAAGSYRTMLGKQFDPDFSPETVTRLKSISIAGPFPHADGKLYFPAPKDSVLRKAGDPWLPIRPAHYDDGEMTDLPGGLRPATLPESAGEDFKPVPSPEWWRADQMEKWLLEELPEPPDEKKKWFTQGYAAAPEHEARTHVQMDCERGAGKDGMLFQSAGLILAPGIDLAIRVSGEDSSGTANLHPLGGERRLAHWRASADRSLWECPASIATALREEEYLRMIPATPAVFRDGWKPGWLKHETDGTKNMIRGTIPGTNVEVQLIAACVERWRPVSGWSLERGRRGQKPVTRVVPAGSVYFFRKTGTAPFPATDAWLKSMSDKVGDSDPGADGFGLALWGKWSEGKHS